MARSAPVLHRFAFADNAVQPLQDFSHPGLDLAYVHFGQTEKDDLLYIQEVKVTGGTDLAYADNLIADHKKLFGESLQLTYNTRVQGISARIRYQFNEPQLADRVLKLGASSASQCSQVRLVPTLVHERIGTQPQVKLSAVRSAIVALGWDAQNVAPWSIAMENLINRLTRLARGQP